MKTDAIEIVDRGRGPQLSSCRITVQDLLPYHRNGWTNDRIREEAMPVLTDEEIEVLRKYIRENWDQVHETERRIKENFDRMRAEQPVWAWTEMSIEEWRTRMKDKLARRKAENACGDASVR